MRKKYEFRRKIFRRDANLVYMYSTSPVKKIVGLFTIKSIIEDDPKRLWCKFGGLSALDETEFFDYFDGMERGFAIKIKDVKAFRPFNPKGVIPNFHPPQSYCYLYHKINLL
jgi:predicted transcriptional regulator